MPGGKESVCSRVRVQYLESENLGFNLGHRINFSFLNRDTRTHILLLMKNSKRIR